jgi:hypothetical protein
MGGPTIMRSFALFEGDRAAMLHIRQDRDVTAFDCEDAIRFRVPRDLADDTTWRLRHSSRRQYPVRLCKTFVVVVLIL